MQFELYNSLLTKYTNLTESQALNIIKLVSNYDESKELLYEIIGLLNDNANYASIVKDIKNDKFGWESSKYKNFVEERRLEDNILENPPEIKEGENECPKCHQRKTLVVEMQTRSADEGYTYYIHCFNPKCRAVTK